MAQFPRQLPETSSLDRRHRFQFQGSRARAEVGALMEGLARGGPSFAGELSAEAGLWGGGDTCFGRGLVATERGGRRIFSILICCLAPKHAIILPRWGKIFG